MISAAKILGVGLLAAVVVGCGGAAENNPVNQGTDCDLPSTAQCPGGFKQIKGAQATGEADVSGGKLVGSGDCSFVCCPDGTRIDGDSCADKSTEGTEGTPPEGIEGTEGPEGKPEGVEGDAGTEGSEGGACTPDCIGKTCGDDGCGGECGSCDKLPPPDCKSEKQARTYQKPSKCTVSGQCQFEEVYEDCEGFDTCIEGVCDCVQIAQEVGCKNKNCGAVDDECGGKLICGSKDACFDPATCGGGGTPNVCGCTPQSDAEFCAAHGAVCGAVTAKDNCDIERPVASCGDCPSDKACVEGACVKEKDGMVYVPAGPFMMGCNEAVDTECEADGREKPYHEVTLSAYWIDKYEVTANEYNDTVALGICPAAKTDAGCNWGVSGRESHPINCVDWAQAVCYCAWRGKRLPAEAEWEKAARGTDGRKYPWGNAALDCNLAVHSVSPCSNPSTAPVGVGTGVSPYGAYDMSGNVYEWVSDWYDAGYYAVSPPSDPQGPSSGTYRVLRGGSWSNGSGAQRASYRDWNYPDYGNNDLGFRCARSSP